MGAALHNGPVGLLVVTTTGDEGGGPNGVLGLQALPTVPGTSDTEVPLGPGPTAASIRGRFIGQLMHSRHNRTGLEGANSACLTQHGH